MDGRQRYRAILVVVLGRGMHASGFVPLGLRVSEAAV